MHQRQRRFHRRMRQVRVIRVELPGQQHALVDDGLERQARKIKIAAALDLAGITDRLFRQLADDVEFALERHVVRELRVARDEHLPHERLGRRRRRAERGIVGRNRAPAEHALAFPGHDVRKNLFALRALRRIVRQEHHADAIFARAGQENFLLRRDFFEEGVRRLDQDARAVAGVDLAAARAAVIEVAQRLQRLPDDGVRLPALDVDDEADTAGIVLELRVVKPLPGRRRCSHPTGILFLLGFAGHCCAADDAGLFIFDQKSIAAQ